jgi:hypothetical protein
MDWTKCNLGDLLELKYCNGNYVCQNCGGAITAGDGEWVHCDGQTYRHPCEPAREIPENSKVVLDNPEPTE